MPSVRCGDVDIYYEDRGAGAGGRPGMIAWPASGLGNAARVAVVTLS